MHSVLHRPSLPIIVVTALLTSLALPCSASGPATRYVSKAKPDAQSTRQFDEDGYSRRLKGPYDLWQDGEGGASCIVILGDEPTLGGLTLDADEDCASKLALKGDPYAWFINPDRQLIIIDATRQALLRMSLLNDGSYKDRRDGDYVNAVLLTRP